MVFFPTPFNGELEYIYSLVEEGIFFTQIKVIKGEQSGNNTDAVLKCMYIMDLESKSAQNYEFRPQTFHFIVSMIQFLSYRLKQRERQDMY